MASACPSRAINSFLEAKVSLSAIQSEVLWTTYAAEHNHGFTACDHATKLLSEMFPDIEVAIIKTTYLWTHKDYSNYSRRPSSPFL